MAHNEHDALLAQASGIAAMQRARVRARAIRIDPVRSHVPPTLLTRMLRALGLA